MVEASPHGFQIVPTYRQLPSVFYRDCRPDHFPALKWFLWNSDLATTLGIQLEALQDLRSFRPLALAYAGHQFGHFTLLGDGRAHLLGEHKAPDGQLWDVQLKGSGVTPFSRRGDGRATLGPMLREYIISEAMAALRIPTTRSLAVMTTGEPVIRDRVLPGAMVMRLAQSHLRVGTFEYAATLKSREDLEALLHFSIQKCGIQIMPGESEAHALLRSVVEKQAYLIAEWMHVGFIHGVMNTDNMSLSGETIDYGPCAFLDEYNESQVFSSIDHQGRYAYGQQPAIAQWNLACLANSLLPLLGKDEAEAEVAAQKHLAQFQKLFSMKWMERAFEKCGLSERMPEDLRLVEEWWTFLKTSRSDFLLAFSALRSMNRDRIPVDAQDAVSDWWERWLVRLETQKGGREAAQKLMDSVNPWVIPRNHVVERVLTRAVEENDLSEFRQYLKVLQQPLDASSDRPEWTRPPTESERLRATFCGT
jgi:uncharacterized protein YdiU (UPF0061 family)